ncbi:hypothetical protein ACEWY4_016172 [Coilia grayii]|uniref:Peptidase S1 domain-containing protein n=1 Tax=Coilia grayii TaxID=363190 RepID=A0ABD1JJT3_9TELE
MPIPLPEEGEDQEETPGEMAIFGAWDMGIAHQLPGAIKYLKLPVVSREECRAGFQSGRGPVIDSKMFCTGPSEFFINVCFSDAGSALVFQNPKTNRVYAAGIVSFETACAFRKHAVSTRISAHLPWIRDIMREDQEALTKDETPEDNLSVPESDGVSTIDIDWDCRDKVSSCTTSAELLVESEGPDTPPSPRHAAFSTTTYYVHKGETPDSAEVPVGPSCPVISNEGSLKVRGEPGSAKALEATRRPPVITDACGQRASLLAKVRAQLTRGKHDNVRVIRVKEAVEENTITSADVGTPVPPAALEKHKMPKKSKLVCAQPKLVCVQEALKENTISTDLRPQIEFRSSAEHEAVVSNKVALASKLPPLPPSLHPAPSRLPPLDPPTLGANRAPVAPLPSIQSKLAQKEKEDMRHIVQRVLQADMDEDSANVWSYDVKEDEEVQTKSKTKRSIKRR